MEQEAVEFGIHRKDLYKRQREAYEQEERNNGELRSTGTTADRKIILLMNFVCHIENVLAQISI